MAERQKSHIYQTKVVWTGNTGQGTSDYRGYNRAHEITAKGKPVIAGSSDPARYNPEELLVASLSTCHMLWYLHLCADAKIVVTGYEDRAEGTMIETEDGGGRFMEVMLKPAVTIRAGGDSELARGLHDRAHHLCFIANSVNFPVRCEPTVAVE